MAAASSTLGEQIREELSCSICLELFTKPKVLPCQHTFCQECLQELARKDETLECPTCRLQVRLPSKGVTGLPDSCIVANMCERLQNQAKPTEGTRNQPQSGNRCSFHPSEEYKVYCKECQKPVCEQCLEGTHDGHSITTIKKAAQERRSTVQALICEGRSILESYCSFIRDLREKEKVLHKQKQQTDNRIIQIYNTLLFEVDQNHRKNLDTIQKERIRVLADVNELSAICDQAEQEMEQGAVEFLNQETILRTGWIRGIAVDTKRNHILITQSTGDWPKRNGEVQEFRPDGKLVRVLGHQEGMKYPQHITVDGEGNILVSDYDKHCIYVFNDDGQFLFKFGSEGSGEGQLKHPRGICTDKSGNIIVADSGNSRVEMFDKTGKFLQHITTDIEDPKAVAMGTQGQVVVTDVATHTVSIFTPSVPSRKEETLECPTCRLQVRLPSKGVTGLPDSCIVANMCERLQNQATLTEGTTGQPQSGNRCSFHTSEEFKVYCKQCQIPVCELCLEEAHNGHSTTTIKKAAQERRPTVQALINEGKNILESYCSFIRDLRDKEKTLNEQKQQTDNEIIQTYNTMLSEVEQNHRKNLDTIQKERIGVLADVNELSAACHQAEQDMEQGGVHFLTQENNLEEVVGKYRDKAAPTPVQTQPTAFQLTDTVVSLLGHGTVQSIPSLPIPAASSNSAAEGKDHHNGNQGQGDNLYIKRTTFGGKGQETGKFLDPSSVTVSEKGEIFVADFWNQRIQEFTMQGISRYQPFPATVSSDEPNLKMNPDNVAMCGQLGYLWVVGRTKCDVSFAVQFRFGKGWLRQSKIDLQRTGWIRGVAVDTKRNHILLTQSTGDWPERHGEVQAYSQDGKLVRIIGEQQGMKYPQHITVDREGNILVSDYDNHCIYVFNNYRQFLFKFGGKGSGEGELKHPRGICTDKSGNIIVADSGNSRVEMFDKTGRFLQHITTDIEDPKAVAMGTQGQVVVTDVATHTVTRLADSTVTIEGWHHKLDGYNKMAGTSSSLGEQIREELSCSICLELFTRPKVLPCQHTFCQECLQQLAGKKKTLECPTCRLQVRLPSKGVTGLPASCIVANMCERLKNQTEGTRERPQSGNRCGLHPFEVLKVYCTECQVPVCVQCLEGTHDDHRTTTMKKAAKERRSTVQALISEGRNILESYCSFIRELRDKEKALHKQKQQTDNRIIQTYNTLLSEVEQNHRKNLDTIQRERIRVLADVDELSAICDQAEQEMEQGGVHFLSQENILEEVVGKYRDKGASSPVQTQPAVFQPTDTLVPLLGHGTVQTLSSVPFLTASTSSNSAAEGKDHLHSNQAKEEHLYRRVTFGGRGEEARRFDCPSGVTMSCKGEIFVADFWNQRIQVFNLHGTYLNQFPTTVSSDEQKMNPDNVAMSDTGQGFLWVVGRTKSDASFAMQFRFAPSIGYSYYGKVGERVSKIDLQRTGWIKGVAVDIKRNRILFTQTTGDSSMRHGEIQLYSFMCTGKLERIIGQQQGMKYPQHITVDGEGNILVSDYDNHCIYVYNEGGQFLFKFGHKGSGEGQLNRPCGICTDKSGNIIVADRHNSRVEMFDKTGKFLQHITTNIQNPKDVAVAPQGQVVVTDDTNHTVTIFTPTEPG
ncbi:uncharacterized protein LOC144886354 [Branchiostoma floridae x Branchiostoma japonicum]